MDEPPSSPHLPTSTESPLHSSEAGGRACDDLPQVCVSRALGAAGQLLKIWDTRSDSLTCTGALRDWAGHEVRSPQGNLDTWIALMHPDDRLTYRDVVFQSIEEGRALECEYRLRVGSEKFTLVREQGQVSSWGTPPTPHLCSIVKDISPEHDLSENLKHLQRMEAFAQLAGGVAHDFNNMLSIILGYTQLVMSDCAPEDPNFSFLQEIEQAGLRATSLTNQLLAFSRKETLKKTQLNLNELLQDTGKMLRRLIGDQIVLDTQPSPDPVLFEADRGQIEQVLINLAVSARDHLPQGGEVTIQTLATQLAEPSIHGETILPPGSYACLQISIRPHSRAPAPAPASDRSLGLPACARIVAQNGGTMLVEPSSALVTEWRVFFPRPKEKPVESLDEPATPKKAVPTSTVLLVKDDTAVRRLAAALISRMGYRVLEARDGEEALDLLEENPGTQLSLLIADLVMPRMGGMDLALHLEAEHPDIRFLFTTGYPDQSFRPETFRAPCAIFQKPFVPSQLAAEVRSIMNASTSNPAKTP